MSVSVAAPDGTVSNDGTITGGVGATADEVLADSDDATFVSLDVTESFRVSFGSLIPSLPAGSVVKSVAPYVRTLTLAGSRSVESALYIDDVVVGNAAAIAPAGLQSWYSLSPVLGETDTSTAEFAFQSFSTDGVTATQVILYVTYVRKPAPEIIAPTGTLTEDNQPTIRWDNANPNLDPDGGPQLSAIVKVFSEADLLAPGFDADTSPATFSAAFFGARTNQPLDLRLPNGDYRVDLIVTQLVNGEALLSDHVTEDITIDVDSPGIPLIDVTNDNDVARVVIDLDDTTGDVTTTGYEVQRKVGDAEWVGVRTATDENGTVAEADEVTIYDYEAQVGEAVTYRARATHTFASGTVSVSEWAEATTPEVVENATWWIKHATEPGRNFACDLRNDGFNTQTREARQSIEQPLGRSDAVVVEDTRGPETGSIVFRSPDDTTRDRLQEIFTAGGVVLLQPPSDHHEPERWVVFTSEETTRLVGQSWIDERDLTYGWTVVARPLGPITDDGGLYPSDDLYPGDDLYPY